MTASPPARHVRNAACAMFDQAQSAVMCHFKKCNWVVSREYAAEEVALGPKSFPPGRAQHLSFFASCLSCVQNTLLFCISGLGTVIHTVNTLGRLKSQALFAEQAVHHLKHKLFRLNTSGLCLLEVASSRLFKNTY